MAVLLLIASFIQFSAPSQFDLRDAGGQNYVTSIKSQQGGTCWTHGTMASIESNLLVTGVWEEQGEIGEPDLAEYHLDWWNGFNNWYNADMDPPSGSGGLTPHEGGDYLVATAYLSRGEGAVRDIDGQSYYTPPSLTNPEYHHYYPEDVQWLTAGDDLASLLPVKEAIMAHGAIATCYCVNSSFMQDYIQYQPPSSSMDPNHSVAIIGWDDNKATQAPEPGAWICKNSWGEGWGFGGFFYISYWDKWCCREPFMGAVSFQNTERLQYQHFYYHDYHGWRDTFTAGADMVMNAWEAPGDHFITAMSFFTPKEQETCSASFYGSFQGGVLSDLITAQDFQSTFRGFHTVELNNPFELEAGDSVYFTMSFSGGEYPYDRTADVPVLLGSSARVIVESSASPGESYYNDGSWHDFQNWSENPYPGTGNFCLKLLGFDSGLIVTPSEDMVFQGDQGGPFTPSSQTWNMIYMGSGSVSYTVEGDGAQWLDLSGPLTGTVSCGQTVNITASINSEAASLENGVYISDIDFVNETTGTGNTSLQVVLVVGEAGVVYSWNMDSDPGWTADTEWEWGVPKGMGGSHGNPDPASGATGNNVCGYNLAGDYAPDLDEKYLTTGAIDCSGLYGTHLRFQRWLGVESSQYDHASVQISTDQQTWFTIWANGSDEITDSDWSMKVYDISSYADTQPQVWIRWVMGTTDSGWEYCGWNLDDVEIWAYGALSAEEQETETVFSMGFAGMNPASSSTVFRCQMPEAGQLTVQVLDISGRVMGTVFNGEVSSGQVDVPFNLVDSSGRRLPAGIYPVVASSAGSTAVARLVVLGN
ncbi:hypothetical protein CSA37_01650 [Candidatus Fermentibacteria bacterium]|nr:MAG: hypothetical protein CSA37_01650 [Candidatus Fermentibacteria bacterium]